MGIIGLNPENAKTRVSTPATSNPNRALSNKPSHVFRIEPFIDRPATRLLRIVYTYKNLDLHAIQKPKRYQCHLIRQSNNFRELAKSK